MKSDSAENSAGLNTTARLLPLQESATASTNDYATSQVDLCCTPDLNMGAYAQKVFSQIQGAEDGSLAVRPKKSSKNSD